MNLIWEQLDPLNLWRPSLEIMILAVIIYYFLMFLKGTRGWAVVVGLITVFLAMATLTSLLELKVLRYLLGLFVYAFALGGMVVFQPELRRMLAEVGNQRLFTGPSQEKEIIEVVVQAAEQMSRDRMGALIAFEQGVKLDGVTEAGVTVHCEATPEMIRTIFFPNNALHDGGIIIKGMFIERAACILPLTRRQDLDATLGTRHRAAIGLTEETDSVVLVVSEERGSISYAYQGKMKRGISVEVLRSDLNAILVHERKTRSWTDRLRSKLLENVRLPSRRPAKTSNPK